MKSEQKPPALEPCTHKRIVVLEHLVQCEDCKEFDPVETVSINQDRYEQLLKAEARIEVLEGVLRSMLLPINFKEVFTDPHVLQVLPGVRRFYEQKVKAALAAGEEPARETRPPSPPPAALAGAGRAPVPL